MKNKWFWVVGFALLLLYTRSFFLFSYILPEIDPDSLGYFLYGKGLFDGNLSVLHSISIDFPQGYPIFLMLIYKLGFSTKAVILVQTLLSISAFCLLFYELLHWGTFVAIVANMGLFLFAIDSGTIGYESTLMTESLFTSLLALFTGVLLGAIRTNNNKLWFLLSILFWLPSYVRSNGVFLYVMLFLLVAVLWHNKQYKTIKILVYPFLILSFLWMGYNYVIDGIPYPGNMKRVAVVLDRKFNKEAAEKKTPAPLQESAPPSDDDTFRGRLQRYIAGTKQPTPHFYANNLAVRFERFYSDSLPVNDEYNYKYHASYAISSEVVKAVYGEFYALDYYKNYQSIVEELKQSSNWRNVKFLPFNVFYKIASLYKASGINTLAVFIALVLSLYFVVRSNSKITVASGAFIVLFLVLCFWLNIVIISFAHGRSLFRYGHTAIFFVYLLPGFISLMFTRPIFKLHAQP
ncbi:MAG: hypothetical protein U0T72_11050 [Chitinophagales bacterium]